MTPRPPSSPLFPYTTLFRSVVGDGAQLLQRGLVRLERAAGAAEREHDVRGAHVGRVPHDLAVDVAGAALGRKIIDRKSTRLNSSHVKISYAVFCLKKKKNKA